MIFITKLIREYKLSQYRKEALESNMKLLCIIGEKRIPAKPHKATNSNGEFIKYECPVCGGFLIKNYPCKCGKMIDWSGEE